MLTTKAVRHSLNSQPSLLRHFLTSQQRVIVPVETCQFFNGNSRQLHHTATSTFEYQSDPFSLVSNELSLLATRMRSLLASEFPKLASGADYIFKMGVEGKHFRPTVC
ncbi:hypothetical protein KSS87_001664 [Heliosperma pusillum]|nr:hypothetical protein KSS87_001664 [Heliosperma pusillum]